MNKFHPITIIIFLALVIAITGCSVAEQFQEKADVRSNIKNLQNEDPEIRLTAVRSLSRMRDHYELITPALIDALQDEDSTVKLVALKALSDWRLKPELEDVLPDIILILENPDETDNMRCSASILLGNIGFDANDVDPEVIDLLIEQFQYDYWQVRSSAIFALRNITSNERAIEPLIARLDDEHPGVREQAAIALGNIGQSAQEAIPKIIEMLDDEERNIPVFATRALGAYGTIAHEAIPHVISALEDGLIAPHEAGATLGRIAKDGETTEMLLGWLANEDDQTLRLTACVALGYLASSDGVVEALLNILNNDVNPTVRSYAAKSLGQAGPSPEIINALLNTLQNDVNPAVRCSAAGSLGLVGPSPEVIDALLNILQNDVDPAVRSSAAKTLGKIEPSSEIIDALIAALDDEDVNVADMAVLSLCSFGKAAASALPKLKEISSKSRHATSAIEIIESSLE